MDFADKIVVVTGASQGFGLAFAHALSAKGAQVVISSENEVRLKQAALDTELDSFCADVTSYEDLQKLAEYTTNKYGRVDMWVNNAGIQIAPSLIEDVSVKKLHHLFEVNFFGYFYGCQAVLPLFKRQGSGVIVNVNSTAGLAGKPGISAYVASKFAIKGLTQSLREELKGTKITVYGIHP